MQKAENSQDFGNESGVDLNYSEAFHTPHPNTPNVLNPPPHHTPPLSYNHGPPQHSSHSSTPVHISTTSSYHHTPFYNHPHYQKTNLSYNESTTNSKRSESRTTPSVTNSPRVSNSSHNNNNNHHSMSSSCGDQDDYSCPLPVTYPSSYHPVTSSGKGSSNLTTRSSEHSYARLTPNSASPLPPYGISFPGGPQSQYVVHYNL